MPEQQTHTRPTGLAIWLVIAGVICVTQAQRKVSVQYAKRVVVVKDGQIILDQPVRKRRSAEVELAATPNAVELEEVLQ